MHDKGTTLAGVPVPNATIAINADNDLDMINGDNDSDAESNHNSIDRNEAYNNSSKASVHSTRSHIPVHSTTSEPPQHPLDEEEPDNIDLPELETQVSILHHSKSDSLPPLDYIPWMEAKCTPQMYRPRPIKTRRKV